MLHLHKASCVASFQRTHVTTGSAAGVFACGCVMLQGMQSIGVPLQDSRSLVRLWAHEALRVFHDRLVDDEDRDWFCGLLADMLPKHLRLQFSDVCQVHPGGATAKVAEDGVEEAKEKARRAAAAAALRGVLFADFLQPGGAENAKYQEATDSAKLLKAVEDALADYNVQVSSCVSCYWPSMHTSSASFCTVMWNSPAATAGTGV